MAVLFGWDPRLEPTAEAALMMEAKARKIKMKGPAEMGEQRIRDALKTLPKEIREHVAMVAQERWNSFSISKESFIYHAAGRGSARGGVLMKALQQSNCESKSIEH